MLSPNLLKLKIPMSGWGGFMEFDAESKFAKIQNSYVWWDGGKGFMEFDAESKFAKIQNSYVWWGGGEGGHLAILHTHSTILFWGGVI